MLANQIKKLDEKFEYYLDSILFEQTETDLTEELRAERRRRADESDFEFCKIYFPQIFRDGWNDLHIYISNALFGIFTVSGSRYFGKTAFTYVTKIIKPIAKGGLGMIGLGMRTQDDSADRSAALVRLLTRNKKLCYDYDINVQQERTGDYIINNKIFTTFGVHEGLRNKFDDEFNRFETIILDDLFNRISCRSDKDNEKVYEFVTAECTGQLKPNGLLIWLFNFVADNSPGKRYAEEHPHQHFNLPALNKLGETNWPASTEWTTEALERKRDSLPYDVWQGDWMNDPIVKGEIMDLDWLRTVRINVDDIIACITAIDPSHGTSPAACDKGIATLAIMKSGHTDILDLYSRKESWDHVFNYIDELRKTYPRWKALLFENDFSQWDYADAYYKQWIENGNTPLPIILFDSKNNKTEFYGSDKESRCMNLVFPFQKGKIRINQDITGSADYNIWRKGYIGFGKIKIPDVFDATASAFIKIGQYKNLGTFRSLGFRKSKEKLFRKV